MNSSLHSSAAQAAAELGHSYIGVEHLLLLTASTPGPVAALLTDSGLTHAAIREDIDRYVGIGTPLGADAPLPLATPRASALMEHAEAHEARDGGVIASLIVALAEDEESFATRTLANAHISAASLAERFPLAPPPASTVSPLRPPVASTRRRHWIIPVLALVGAAYLVVRA